MMQICPHDKGACYFSVAKVDELGLDESGRA